MKPLPTGWNWKDRSHLRTHPQAPQGLLRAFVSWTYSVQWYETTTEWGVIIRLAIGRHDNSKVRSWSDLQRIKNDLVGPERVAVEMFPPQGSLIDQADMYHLWVLPEGFQFPFGLSSSGGNAVFPAIIPDSGEEP